jgi:hypothetical protein
MRDHDAGFIPVRYTFLSNIFRTTRSKADFASNKTKTKPEDHHLYIFTYFTKKYRSNPKSRFEKWKILHSIASPTRIYRKCITLNAAIVLEIGAKYASLFDSLKDWKFF